MKEIITLQEAFARATKCMFCGAPVKRLNIKEDQCPVCRHIQIRGEEGRC
jgi:rubrerythrin